MSNWLKPTKDEKIALLQGEQDEVEGEIMFPFSYDKWPTDAEFDNMFKLQFKRLRIMQQLKALESIR